MSTAKSIAGIVPGLQATALVGANLKTMNYYLKPRKKKKGMGKMVKMGVGNLVAIPLIGATAGMINTLD